MIEIRRTFNRDRGFKLVEPLNGYTFTPETNAHTFFIECVDKVNGLETVVPFDAGSTVSARFLKTDHVTELVEGSLNTDGAAVVTLPSECYSVPGRFLLTILVTTGSTTICVYAATGTVIAADSSTVNVSENASREIDEKIAELNAAAAQVNSAISAGSAKITEINQAAAAARASIPQDYTALSDSVGDLKSAINAFSNNVGVSLSGISEQKTIDDATIVTANSNGESIQVTTDAETVITHLRKNLYPYSDIQKYIYAWSQIMTKEGMQNPVFLKGGHSYIISMDKIADETKLQLLVKAAKPDGTWVNTVSDINFHNWKKTSGTSYNNTINAFSSNASFNNEGIAFIAPVFDVFIDMVVSSTSTTAVGSHPMIELSDADAASSYEKYTLLETITVNGAASLVPLLGLNTIYSASGTFDVAYYQVANLDENIEDLQYKSDHVYNGDYTSELKGTSPVLLNLNIGSTVDLSPLNTAGTLHYTLLIDDVVPGEYFQMFAVDGNTARPWAFLDADNKLLSVAYNAYARNVVLTAPQNAKKLLVQVGSAYLSNASVIRVNSLSFLSTGSSIDINTLNNQYDVTEKLENATSIIKGDSPTVIKSRANLFSLIHFSDVHGNADNIQRILDFNNKYSKYIMDIIHTGDAPSTYFGDNNPFAFVGGEQIMEVVGNHECWIQGETWPRPYTATEAQVYEKFFAPFISSWNVTSPGTNLCYYYKDYATAKVRLIVLDCIHYDSAQETWFETALAGAKTNSYRVVAVTHYPAMTGLTNIDCTFGTYGESISAQTPPTGTDQVERMPESAFNVVDTFITGGGEFVCWLSGHTHGDFIGTVTGHTNQIQIIITTANTTNGHGDAARVSGTKTQDAFNIFVVDGTNKLIKLIRIGATRDRYMRIRETLCVDYRTKNVVSNS